ncbi:MAG: hypothetical protein LQ350_007459 [Teloschistes chrysophthalmus]|nr:MAG: hypothetical protein LQ350_007459 [Niorma chrysophthalma]
MVQTKHTMLLDLVPVVVAKALPPGDQVIPNTLLRLALPAVKDDHRELVARILSRIIQSLASPLTLVKLRLLAETIQRRLPNPGDPGNDDDDDDDDEDDDSTKESEKQESTKPPESKHESTQEPTSTHASTTGPQSSSKPVSSTSRSGTCRMPPEVTLPPDSSSADDNSGQETSVVPSSLSGETFDGGRSTVLSSASKPAGPTRTYDPRDCPNNGVQQNAPYCPTPTKPTGFSCGAASNIGAATFNPATWCVCGDHDYPTMEGDKPCAYSTTPSVATIKPGPITPPPQPKTTDPPPTPTTYPPESVRPDSSK